MLKYKTIRKDYTEKGGGYQLVLPLNMEVLIPEDDSVRLLYHMTEELDYTNLNKAYSSKGGNPAVKPNTLFRVLVYAYMNDIYTSRKIEEACGRDINFMWLLQGQKVPDHNTIARVRNGRLKGIIEGLFNQLVVKLGELGEIQYENILYMVQKLKPMPINIRLYGRKPLSKMNRNCKKKLGRFLQNSIKNSKPVFH